MQMTKHMIFNALTDFLKMWPLSSILFLAAILDFISIFEMCTFFTSSYISSVINSDMNILRTDLGSTFYCRQSVRVDFWIFHYKKRYCTFDVGFSKKITIFYQKSQIIKKVVLKLTYIENKNENKKSTSTDC